MDRIRGRRFDDEPKLNKRKVFATVIAIIVIIMVIMSIKNLFKKEASVTEMTIPTAYFTIYQDSKYGVIDSKGNIVIKPTYDEMIVIPNSSKAIFMCTYDVDYNTGNYKTKVIDASGKTLLEGFNDIQPIENTDSNDIWYEDNVLKYQENGKYGLIDFNGKKILDAEYTKIYALNGIEKSIIVENNDNKGLVNSSLGELILPCEYSDIISLSEGSAEAGYIVSKDGKKGVVSATGKVILENNYNDIKQVSGNNMYVVNDGTLKIIDNSLNTIKEGRIWCCKIYWWK